MSRRQCKFLISKIVFLVCGRVSKKSDCVRTSMTFQIFLQQHVCLIALTIGPTGPSIPGTPGKPASPKQSIFCFKSIQQIYPSDQVIPEAQIGHIRVLLSSQVIQEGLNDCRWFKHCKAFVECCRIQNLYIVLEERKVSGNGNNSPSCPGFPEKRWT